MTPAGEAFGVGFGIISDEVVHVTRVTFFFADAYCSLTRILIQPRTLIEQAGNLLFHVGVVGTY